MRISGWSSDVCSSDLGDRGLFDRIVGGIRRLFQQPTAEGPRGQISILPDRRMSISLFENADRSTFLHETGHFFLEVFGDIRSEEHTSELQSLMRHSYAVFCLKKQIHNFNTVIITSLQ